MKAHPKTNINRPKKIKKQSLRGTKTAISASSRSPILRHLKFAEHKHTGKLIHHRHTSHLALMIILFFVGIFLFVSASITQAGALEITKNGTISVGAIVPGPPPSEGAVITSPADGLELTDQYTIEVSGTCVLDTFVVVSNNGQLVGSTYCTAEGVFDLEVQLQLGDNILSALNYDSFSQAGPETQPVTVYVIRTVVTPTPTPPAEPTPAPTPVPLPENPSIIPGIDSDAQECDTYKTGNLPTGGEPHIQVVCVPRLFSPGLEQVLGIVVWGGTPPYAVSANWFGGSGDTLLSIPSPGYHKLKFSYSVAGNYRIAFKLKDAGNKTAITETAVQISGGTKTPIAVITDDILHKSWFETPVPLYVMAVALTLGFWGGDIFERKFGLEKTRRKTRKA